MACGLVVVAVDTSSGEFRLGDVLDATTTDSDNVGLMTPSTSDDAATDAGERLSVREDRSDEVTDDGKIIPSCELNTPALCPSVCQRLSESGEAADGWTLAEVSLDSLPGCTSGPDTTSEAVDSVSKVPNEDVASDVVCGGDCTGCVLWDNGCVGRSVDVMLGATDEPRELGALASSLWLDESMNWATDE